MLGATFLKLSNGFRRKQYAALCLLAYGLAYYMVACAMRIIPLSVAYATWCGSGTLLTMAIGVVFFKENFRTSGYVGMILLLAGIVILNLL